MMGAIAGDIIRSVYEHNPIKTKDFFPLPVSSLCPLHRRQRADGGHRRRYPHRPFLSRYRPGMGAPLSASGLWWSVRAMVVGRRSPTVPQLGKRGGDASRPGGLGLHLGGGGAAPGPPERRDHPRPSRGDQGRAGHRPGDISGPDPHIIRCRIDTEDFHRPGDISGLDSHGQSDDPRPRAGRFRLRAGADGRRHPPRPCLRCVLPRHRSRSADRIPGRRVLRR